MKKEVEIIKDEPGQSQISVFGAVGKLTRDVENLKSKVRSMEIKNQEIGKSIADLDLNTQLQESKTVSGEFIYTEP